MTSPLALLSCAVLIGCFRIASASKARASKIVIGVDGGTESIRACCFDAFTGEVIGQSCAFPYKTYHPQGGWAEQNPEDWYLALGRAVKGAIASVIDHERSFSETDSDNHNTVQSRLSSICIDTTCCSVVALDSDFNPLRPSLLWMDTRSESQTREILTKCKGDPALSVNSNGEGPISAEWMTPKALWIKQNEPDVWKKAATICEYQDYINWKLTGVICASSCNAAVRWHWNGIECITDDSCDGDEKDRYPGRPLSMYAKLDLMDLAEKLPRKCIPMGSLVGSLTREAALHLGLPAELPVIQGGPDAFVGMIGLGCIHPGQLCLITGSSHLHCVVTSSLKTASSIWGAYQGAPLPALNFAEGGQSSTGSIIRWAKNLFGNNADYSVLDDEASLIDPGSGGLVALETFQGSRTPITDALARGALIGLTLAHTRAHIWRAMMEAVCFGTRSCIDGLVQAGHACDEITMAGGAVRSQLWLQMHADVTGRPVRICENINAPLLGCAILASIGSGIHPNVEEAVKCMVRISQRVHPNKDNVPIYSNIFTHVYSKLSLSVRPLVHDLFNLRGGHSSYINEDEAAGGDKVNQNKKYCSGHDAIVSPSLLASDWSDIKSEVLRCIDANATRLHLDVFDGVYLDSPYALTFGPQMIKAIRSVSDVLILDVHLCVDRPARYIPALADAGANRVIFQWEAMKGDDNISKALEASSFALLVKKHGMHPGISINPETEVSQITPLLIGGEIDTVDLLAVKPGFGGQEFQSKVLDKVKFLRSWCDENGPRNLQIMVDGGIQKETARLVLESGAQILVAGTFLFVQSTSVKEGVKQLQYSSSSVEQLATESLISDNS